MKFLFFSCYGESLPIAWRLMQEGAECKVYLHQPTHKGNYQGLVPKVNLDGLKAAVKWADLVIFDITRANNKTKQDLALLKLFGLPLKSKGVFGPVADKLKKHTQVIGAAAWCEEMELDRAAGAELARNLGLHLPPSQEFTSLKAGAKFLEAHQDRLWVFKPHGNLDLDLTYVEKYSGELLGKMKNGFSGRLGDSVHFLLQEKIEGTLVSTEAWWSGAEFVHFNHTVEDKEFLTDGLGPNVGSMLNAVWLKQNPDGFLVKELRGLAPYLKSAGYVGPWDINCIVRDGVPYYLEHTPRLGYDAFYCLLTLWQDSLTTFFTQGFKGSFFPGLAVGIRISIPPYPYASPALLKTYARDVPIAHTLQGTPDVWWEDVYLGTGGLKCAGSDGILGVVTARGKTLGEAVNRVYRTVKKLRIGANLQYRTDLSKAEQRIRQLQRQGLDIF